MINIDYLGLRCGVCGKDFQENDDVVVCPECGTPSHRTCYKENKGCPNLEKHGTDFVFEGFDKIKESARGVKNNKSDSAADSNSGELQNSEKEKTMGWEANLALKYNKQIMIVNPIGYVLPEYLYTIDRFTKQKRPGNILIFPGL